MAEELILKEATEEEKLFLKEEEYKLDATALAESEFEKVLSKAVSTSEVLIKVVNNRDEFVSIIAPTLTHSAPIVQIPRSTLDFYCQGDVVIDKDMFRDYKFELLFTYVKVPTMPTYNNKMEELINDYIRTNGSSRYKYCFTVKQKLGFGTISVFIDCITKNFVGMQGLELFIGDGVKNNKIYYDNSIHVQKVVMFNIGYAFTDTSDTISPGTMVTSFGNTNVPVISENQKSTVDDLYAAFVTNNTLKARYISITSASMYSGKDATYQLVSETVDNVSTIRTNTPPLLVIELGNLSNLVPSGEENSVPNVIVCQGNALNNYYLNDNMSACDAQSNFCIMLPVY